MKQARNKSCECNKIVISGIRAVNERNKLITGRVIRAVSEGNGCGIAMLSYQIYREIRAVSEGNGSIVVLCQVRV